MPFLRFSRDKRGYEHTYLLHASAKKSGPARLLYWYRTPPGVKVGRAPFDETVQEALEAQYPGICFDWPKLMSTPLPPPDAEHWRERRRAEKAARQARQAAEREPREPDDLAEVSEQVEPVQARDSAADTSLSPQTATSSVSEPPVSAAPTGAAQNAVGAGGSEPSQATVTGPDGSRTEPGRTDVAGRARRRRRRGGRRRREGASNTPGAAAQAPSSDSSGGASGPAETSFSRSGGSSDDGGREDFEDDSGSPE